VDEFGRANTPAEVDALIAQIPRAVDPYEVALEVMRGASEVIVASGGGGSLYTLWACFTDWVELQPEERAKALSSMRQAATQWGRIKDDESAQKSYFDYWMYDVMDVTTALPRGWEMSIEKASDDVYRVTATSAGGTSVSATGAYRGSLTHEVAQRVRAIESSS
jgi:hypothetical protein